MNNRLSLLLFACCTISAAKAQYLSKQLESFNHVGTGEANCWTSDNLLYNSNAGQADQPVVVLDTINKVEGAASHKVSYTMHALNSSIVIDKPYPYHPKDFSYLPAGISFWIKGTSGNHDRLRIVLFEDNNLNGSYYSAPNEIYDCYNDTILGSTQWTKLFVPFSQLNLLYPNGGDNKLDLNRIGYIRLEVFNQTQASQSSSFNIDNLRWETYATVPQPGNNLLKSIILPLHVRNDWLSWSVAQWENEILKMKNIGLSKMIVQFSQIIYNTNQSNQWGVSYYQPASASWINASYATINNIVTACVNQQFKIVFGLSLDHDYWYYKTAAYGTPSFYDTIYTHQQQTINEINGLFKNSPAFGGWYLPQEFNELYWESNTARNLLANHLKKVCTYIKSTDTATTHPVSTAPFFYGTLPADLLAAWYSSLFDTLNAGGKKLDLMYMQDGIGIGSHRVGIDIPQYLPGIKTAVTSHQTAFGVVAETFDPYDCQGADTTGLAGVPKITRIKRQLANAGAITSELSAFSWVNFATEVPGDGYPGSDSLYNDYLAYYNSVTGGPAPNGSAGHHKTTTVNINAFPNPTSGEIRLSISNSHAGRAIASLFNMEGRCLYTDSFQLMNGGTVHQLHLPGKLITGPYLLQVRGTGFTQTIKILINHERS